MTRYIQKGSFDAAELDGEVIILNTDQFAVTKVNQVGGYCWSLLKEAQTADSLTRAVMEQFSPDCLAEEVQQDIEDFMQSLLQYELIQHVD